MTNDVEARLRDIEERAKKATPGPWEWGEAGHAIQAPSRTVLDAHRRLSFLSRDDAAFIAGAREWVPWLLQQLAASRSEVERLRGALEQAAEGLECVAECMAINDGGKKEDYDAWLFARDARTALAPKETAPDEKRCSCDLVNCCGCPVHCYCGGKGSSLCRCALAPKETPR